MKAKPTPTKPPHPGEVLRPSKDPHVRRWMRIGDPARPPKKTGPAAPTGHEVDYHHPTTGETRRGVVHASGAQGATVLDKETGEAHKVPHGRYLSTAQDVEAAKPQPKEEIPNYRELHPGLNKYPAPGIKAEKGGPSDNWTLRWTDAQGRAQRAYPTAYLKENAERKFDGMVSFGKRLPDFRRTVAEHLALGPTTELGLLAAMARIVDETLIRAGGESEDTHGISTLEKRHLKVHGAKVTMSYIGKGSVPQEHTITDRAVAATVRHLLELPGDHVWQFEDHRGQLAPVTAAKLRAYIEDHTGGTTKSFRTWHATRLFSEAIDKLGPPSSPADAEAKIKRAAAEAVAPALGHKKAKAHSHFVAVDKHKPANDASLHELAQKHGGRHVGGGVVALHGAKAAKAFADAAGPSARALEKKDHPKDVAPDYEWEPMTSLNNYIDPKVVEAYRQGLTLSTALRKGSELGGGRGRSGLSPSEERFAHLLDVVDGFDPYRVKGRPDANGRLEKAVAGAEALRAATGSFYGGLDDAPTLAREWSVDGHRCRLRFAKAGFAVLTIQGPATPLPFHAVLKPVEVDTFAREAVRELRKGRCPRRGVFHRAEGAWA